jgi:lipoprotein
MKIDKGAYMKKLLITLLSLTVLFTACNISDVERAEKERQKTEEENIKKDLRNFFKKDKVTVILNRNSESIKCVLEIADELDYELKFLTDTGENKLVYIFYKKGK